MTIAQTFRTLRRSPGYLLVSVLTLGLGIGASTGMFSLLYATLLRPLPYDEAGLFRMRDHYVPTGATGSVSAANYADLATAAGRVAELAAYGGAAFNVAGEDRPARAAGLRVSHNFFRVLGMEPTLGRGFVEGEDREGGGDIAVISHALWRDAYGGAADVLGRTILLDARSHAIVGVMPSGFWFPGEPQVIVPFGWTAGALANRGTRIFYVLGRTAPGASLPAVDAELRDAFARLAEAYPEVNRDWSIETQPFAEVALGANRTALTLLTGAVFLVLLIGAVNVANLMLVRAERRGRELAVRVALGAGRQEIVRQNVLEGVLLALFGSALGVLLAWVSMRVLVALFGDSLPRAGDVGVTWPVLGFAVGVAAAVGAMVGLVPGLRTATDDVFATLREGGRGGIARGTRLQKSLVIGEVTLAVLLVSAAGLFIHSFWKINSLDTGVELDETLVFSLQLPAAAYPAREDVGRFYDRVLPEIERLPNVRAVGLTDRRPLQGGFNITRLASPDDPGVHASFVEVRQTTPGFFPAAGIPLRAGRAITEEDVRLARPVVVVSDVVAGALFASGGAIGRRILHDWTDDGSGFEIVGVVGSVREFGVRGDPRPAVYWPFQSQWDGNNVVVVVKASGGPAAVMPAIQRILGREDPTLPVFDVRTMREVMIETTGQGWLAANLFVAFGGMALGLAALGIFGVLAFVVEQRTREIGVRVALGASPASVRGLVVGQGLRLVGVGLGLGLVLSLLASRLLADLLFEVQPSDPVTLALVAAVCLGAAALAAYLPALRATRVSPMTALRAD